MMRIPRTLSLLLAVAMVAGLFAAPASASTRVKLNTLTVTLAGTGIGTVTSSPAGIDCGATCSASFASNSTVALTAVPDANSTFSGWSGACTGTGACSVNMNAARSVTATFAAITRVVTVTKAGSGNGTVTSSPAGIDCGATCSASFNRGSTVTLTATPDVNSTFSGWSGACTGTGSCVLTVTAALSVTATFAPITRTVTVTKAGSGNGTVTSSPAGINCGATCSSSFNRGSSVTLTAAPDVNSTFSGWSGACTGTGSCVLTVTAALSVTATFAAITRVVTVTKAGAGNGTVTSSPAGIGCGTTCSASFNQGSSVTLTATPDANSTFSGWSGACTGTGSCVLTIDAAKAVTATFAPITRTVTVTSSGTGGGTVTSSPAGINCGATCSASFNQGSSVTLTAAPDADSTFSGWTGACAGTGSCVLTIDAAKAVTATFTAITRVVTVTKAGTGVGTVTSSPAGINCGATCSASFNQGSTVTLTATPDANSTFTGWSGACTGTGSCVLTIDAAKAVTATFAPITRTVTVTPSGTGGGTVTSTPAGINCGATCSASFNQGSAVTLTATPDGSSDFTGWSGACTGTGTCVLTIDAAKAVTATFAIKIYTLTVTRAGTGGGTVTSSPPGIDCGATCAAGFPANTIVALSASPDVNSTFTGWSGACTGAGACSVTITGAKSVTATFTPITHVVAVTPAGTGGGTVTSSPGGINCGATCSASFNQGSTVTLSASPASDSNFAGWGGDCLGTGSCVIGVSADANVTATFTLKVYALSVAKDGTGSGSVTGSPAGIDCGATCSAGYNAGSIVTLTATPGADSDFAGWGGACSGTGSCQVTMTSPKAVIATFTLKTFQLSVSKNGDGSGAVTSSPAGITCGATCSATFDIGTPVTLTPDPAANSDFAGWSGACSGTGDCLVAMNAAASVIATFTLKVYSLSVTADGSGGGSVTSSPAGIDCGATCSAGFNADSTVTLTASPNADSAFTGWSGACTGIDTCQVTMSGAQGVTATFVTLLRQVSVTKTGNGVGTVTSSPAGIDCGATCTGAFRKSASVTLSAAPDPGSSFIGWGGDCSGVGDCILEPGGDNNVSANFAGPRQPDAQIKLSTSLDYVGNDIYNLTGTDQSQLTKMRAAGNRGFFIRIQNDGAQSDSFTVQAEGFKSPFFVHYYYGTTDITAEVVAGTFTTEELGVGQNSMIKMLITAKLHARTGKIQSWLITATSTASAAAQDAVSVTAKVR